MTRMQGKTEEAAVPILKQAFWSKGTTLTGKVTRLFETQPEPGKVARCFQLQLPKFLTVDGSLLSSSEKLSGAQKLERVGVPEMTGLLMAIQACGTAAVKEDDEIQITCTGQTDTGKGNPRTDFSVIIDRP